MEKILLLIILVDILFMPANSNLPEDRCEVDGQTVCTSCQMVGVCTFNSSSGVFEVENRAACVSASGEFCDDSIVIGTCIRYSPSVTTCGCQGEKACNVDPNNENVYFKCDGENFTESFYCENSHIDMISCNCNANSPTTYGRSTPSMSENVSSNTYTALPETPTNFPEPSTSLEPTASTTQRPLPSTTEELSPSTTAKPTQFTEPATFSTTEFPCPVDCHFVDDPSSCEKYYVCDNGVLVPNECPGSLCFNQETCYCE